MSFDELLKELQQEYKESFPEVLNLLEQKTQQLRKEPKEEKLLIELIDEVHKIHGSAGSYELMEISEVAKHWEKELYQLQKKEKRSQKDFAKSLTHIAKMKQIISTPS